MNDRQRWAGFAGFGYGSIMRCHRCLSELATTYGLSVYDTAYLELAQRRELVLGCNDEPLREAAKRSGVRLWE
jgi:predicted nucleic acid-binding protein